jgi:hypothetical protein
MQRAEAAWYLGMGPDHFDRHVKVGLPAVYSGDLRLYRVRDLDAWLERHLVANVASAQQKRPGAAATARGMAQGETAP